MHRGGPYALRCALLVALSMLLRRYALKSAIKGRARNATIGAMLLSDLANRRPLVAVHAWPGCPESAKAEGRPAGKYRLSGWDKKSGRPACGLAWLVDVFVHEIAEVFGNVLV
jgi:hypothetical protein